MSSTPETSHALMSLLNNEKEHMKDMSVTPETSHALMSMLNAEAL